MSKEKYQSLPLEKVDERILHWTKEVNDFESSKLPISNKNYSKKKQSYDTNRKLLLYWLEYKKKYYPNN